MPAFTNTEMAEMHFLHELIYGNTLEIKPCSERFTKLCLRLQKTGNFIKCVKLLYYLE